MQRSKSYKDLFDPPPSTASIMSPICYQGMPHSAMSNDNPKADPAFYASSYHSNNPASSTIVGSILSNASTIGDYPRRAINPNLIQDDVSSSSTGHLPKPPPGIPSQNAR